MNVMTALVLAFTLGLGLAQLKNDTLKNAARDFQDIIVRMISAVILPLLPIYIFGILLNMTHSGTGISRVNGIYKDYRHNVSCCTSFCWYFRCCIAALFAARKMLLNC